MPTQAWALPLLLTKIMAIGCPPPTHSPPAAPRWAHSRSLMVVCSESLPTLQPGARGLWDLNLYIFSSVSCGVFTPFSAAPFLPSTHAPGCPLQSRRVPLALLGMLPPCPPGELSPALPAWSQVPPVWWGLPDTSRFPPPAPTLCSNSLFSSDSPLPLPDSEFPGGSHGASPPCVFPAPEAVLGTEQGLSPSACTSALARPEQGGRTLTGTACARLVLMVRWGQPELREDV